MTAVTMPPMDAATVRQLYAAFNAKDIDAVLARMQPDVDWPDMQENRRLIGHDAVRAYWLRQFELIDPAVEPRDVVERNGTELVVEVHQVVRNLQGDILSDQVVHHVYTLRNGLIAAMDVYRDGILASAPRLSQEITP
jgi:ketosteroid isomerase-like protein